MFHSFYMSSLSFLAMLIDFQVIHRRFLKTLCCLSCCFFCCFCFRSFLSLIVRWLLPAILNIQMRLILVILELTQYKNNSMDWRNIFVLNLPRFIARLFGERKHAVDLKQRNIFSPWSRSYIDLALGRYFLKCLTYWQYSGDLVGLWIGLWHSGKKCLIFRHIWEKGLILTLLGILWRNGQKKYAKTTPIPRVSIHNLSFKPNLTRILRFLVSKTYRQNPLVGPFLGFKNKQTSEFCR